MSSREGRDSPSLLCSCEIPPGMFWTGVVSSIKEGHGSVGASPEEVMGLIKGLEHFPYGAGLGIWECSPGEGKVVWRPPGTFQGTGEGMFIRRTQGMGSNGKRRNLGGDIGKAFLAGRMGRGWNRIPEKLWIPGMTKASLDRAWDGGRRPCTRQGRDLDEQTKKKTLETTKF